MDALHIQHICKGFDKQTILDDLNLTVPEHSVFGFIGKNGAGKTTLMKLILGFLKADSGTITVCGERAGYGYTRTNRLIGYLPDVPHFYGYMSAAEYLTLCSKISHLKPMEMKKRSSELLTLVGLENVKKSIRGFSRGTKQRLGIATALLNRPKLLICDEATSALDPQGRKEILDLLALAGQQATVLFSTHILTDVERICDQLGLLNDGKIVLQGGTDKIKQQYGSESLQISMYNPEDATRIAKKLENLPFIHGISISAATCTVKVTDARRNSARVVSALAGEKLALKSYQQLESTLESIYLEMVK
ncbi:MAG: ATP-binding cassette domain-containing protein [Sporolactobacillus sp.]